MVSRFYFWVKHGKRSECCERWDPGGGQTTKASIKVEADLLPLLLLSTR